ncbi:MAG: DUF6516 family protein [Promethearchaeota archaeon]
MSSQPSQVRQYFTNLRLLVQAHPYVLDLTLNRERVSQDEGFNQLSVELVKNHRLEVFEYYGVKNGLIKYRYQLLDSKNNLIARWDNAPHHPDINTHPHPLHTPMGVKEHHPKPLPDLLDELDKFW